MRLSFSSFWASSDPAIKLGDDLRGGEVLQGFAAADEVVFAVDNQHFSRSVARVVVRGHGEAVGAGILEAKQVADVQRVDLAVPAEGVGFADVSHDSVNLGSAQRVADVEDVVVGLVEHGADHVVEAAVHASEDRGSGLLDDVGARQEVAGLADQVFARLEHQGQVFSHFLAKLVELLAHHLPKLRDVRFDVLGFVLDLEAAAEVDVLELVEFPGHVEEDVRSGLEDVHVEDVGAGVHVYADDVELEGRRKSLYQRHLVD